MGLFIKIFLLIIAQVVLIITCVVYHIDDFDIQPNAQDDKFKQIITSINETVQQQFFSKNNVPDVMVQTDEDTNTKQVTEDTIPQILLDKELTDNQSVNNQIEVLENPIKKDIQEESKIQEIVKESEKAIEEKTSLLEIEENSVKSTKTLNKVKINEPIIQPSETTAITDEKVKKLFEQKKADNELNNKTLQVNKPLVQNNDTIKTSTVSAQAIQKEISTIVNENRIIFKRLSTEVTQKSIQTIEKIAQILKENPTIKVEIGGHTDAKGDEEVNAYVSKHRALSVQKLLVKFGIEQDRLSAVGYGESQPIVQNDSQGYSAKNRRVEFKIIKE